MTNYKISMATSSTENDIGAGNEAGTTTADSPMNEAIMAPPEDDDIDGAATADDANEDDDDVPMEDENDTTNNDNNGNVNDDDVDVADNKAIEENVDDAASNAASEKEEEEEEENKDVKDDEEEDTPTNNNDNDDNDGTSSSTPSKKRPADNDNNNNSDADLLPLPTLPLKRARTAYFIFAQDKREELKQKYQGEGVAAISKATGELWKALQQKEKEGYEGQAAQEREKYMKDKQRLIDAGVWPESNSGGNDAGEYDEDAILFPIGRIRKICKLDGDVKGMSKEATLLIAKATELFASKLGSEVVTMAQMSNRRKLLPDDVVEVCSVKERFMFLKDDLQDLIHEQKEIQKEKENEKASSGKSDKSGGGEGKAASSSLLSYFGKVHND